MKQIVFIVMAICSSCIAVKIEL